MKADSNYFRHSDAVRMPSAWWVPVGLFCVIMFALGLFLGGVVFC
jgi:hypothetical protein